MNWLNIHTSTLDSDNFVSAEPRERATWLCLLRFCAGQENGGIITDCKTWKDRQWQQTVKVTKEEIDTKCGLWEWQDNNLVLYAYPIEQEKIVKERRANGSLGGRPSNNHKVNHKVNHNLTTRVTTSGNVIVKESNGNDKKEDKTQYAEFVYMTKAEYDKLVATHGEPLTKQMIGVLDNYKGSHGKKYASDYRAILSWVIERVKNNTTLPTKQQNDNNPARRVL